MASIDVIKVVESPTDGDNKELQEQLKITGRDAIPIDVLRYFNIYHIEELGVNDERNLVFMWEDLKKEGKEVPDMLSLIGELERKMGHRVGDDEDRISRIYNYYRISKQAEGILKIKKSFEGENGATT